ncbi:hypothetical protein KSF_065560 [Reticulibacter mediterranei]|uniref:Uncharacterized protein n=1 Tax=Reticulibacter mediterranei TaxID=2778369 RepID=A0A8J3IQ08_9CHLR|nr:hypothetical protein [Reticulibacter mediterranei]GHO96508.1 hypothetical protein KSF_065560 [Reticulibacter mediterranei]
MDEEARQLREDNSRLKAELKQKEDRIGKLEGLLMVAPLRREELERHLGNDSHTSSKPPSSDGLGHGPRESTSEVKSILVVSQGTRDIIWHGSMSQTG